MIKQAHGIHGFLPQSLWRLQRFALDAMLMGMFAIAGCAQHHSSLPHNSPAIDGMTIYIGVIPAKLVQGHTIALGDPETIHRGTPKYGNSHHLAVALFDTKTRARINDTRISAGPYESTG